LPLPLMIVGIVLGILAIVRGEVGLGVVGVVLSILFGIIGTVLGIASFGVI
jgi:hypothetical protein